MKALWNESFELFRRHFVLWVPCLIAGILMLVLGRLHRAEIHWLFRYFTTQQSVLGGEVASSDPEQARHKAMMIIYPLGFIRQFLEVCFFVVALAATKNLVQMIIESQRPALNVAVRVLVPRWKEILQFSLKYLAALAVFGGALIVLTTSPLTPQRFHEFVLAKIFLSVLGLGMEGCIAWLLVPAAIRLLRSPCSPTVSAQDRKVGTIFAVVTSAGSLVLGNLLGTVETGVTLDSQWQAEAITVMNAIITNAPQVLLFIALALLAIQTSDKGPWAMPDSQTTWANRLSRWLRRAREWPRGSC